MEVKEFIDAELDKQSPVQWKLDKILINQDGLLRISLENISDGFNMTMDFNKHIIESYPEFFADLLSPNNLARARNGS